MEAEAEVVGDTERQMRIRMPVDVEPLRIVEHLFVAVGRRVVHRYFVARGDACTRELGVDYSGTTEIVQRIVVANDLLDSPGNERRISAELGQLVRVTQQGQ